DTIVALATPAGRGGIGVVRLAGPDAVTIAAALLRLNAPLQPRHATLCDLIQPQSSVETGHAPSLRDGGAFSPGEKIDEVVATFYAAPHSYTTDDIVEIAAHGAPIVLRHIVELALARGA